jgi:hypothetical protein
MVEHAHNDTNNLFWLTETLVEDLQKLGFTPEQARASIKATL